VFQILSVCPIYFPCLCSPFILHCLYSQYTPYQPVSMPHLLQILQWPPRRSLQHSHFWRLSHSQPDRPGSAWCHHWWALMFENKKKIQDPDLPSFSSPWGEDCSTSDLPNMSRVEKQVALQVVILHEFLTWSTKITWDREEYRLQRVFPTTRVRSPAAAWSLAESNWSLETDPQTRTKWPYYATYHGLS